MLQKTTVILFSLIVSITLLMHVVLPHHHHGGMPCFTIVEGCHGDTGDSGCCQDHKDTHSNCCSHENHDHPSGEKCNSCVLDQLVIVDSNHDHGKTCCMLCDHHHHSSDFVQAVLFAVVSFDFSLPDPPKEFRQTPNLTNYHSVLTSQHLGFRAPPFC